MRWIKSVSAALFTGFNFSNFRAMAHGNGYQQIGNPFRFDKIVVPPANFASKADIWWPTKGRTPTAQAKRFRLDETYDAAMHTELSYPNPFDEPDKCLTFPSLGHSWLCDPDRLLNIHEQHFVENKLLQLRDTSPHTCNDKTHYYQAAVAVAADIVVNENETSQQATDRFANALLRRWGIGNKGCHDGMVLVLVKNLKTASLATRENVDTRVANDLFKSSVRRMMSNTLLSAGSTATAVTAGVEMVTKSLPKSNFGLSWTATLLLTLAGAYIASVGCAYFSLSSLLKKNYAAVE